MRESSSIRQLARRAPWSKAKLRLIVNEWLSRTPSERADCTNVKHLICDGTFIHRPVCVLVAMNGETHTVIAGEYGLNENSMNDLRSFFQPLKENGLAPKSCTIDGNPQIARVLLEMWPNIIIQRCLVHVQRQGLMWCRHKPNRTDAKHLRDIFLAVTSINTVKERDLFYQRVYDWEQEFGQDISHSPERGRVFSDLKRARSMLIKALPSMFHYLSNPAIPRTTNGLEGYFSRLKHDYRNHRGLAPHKRFNYFKWYFHLKPK